MSNFSSLTIDEILRLPPLIFGKIRWKHSAGGPVADPSTRFDLLVEEHTTSEFVDEGGGHYGVQPGTGIWKKASADVSFRAAADEGVHHVAAFRITGLHHNVFPDGFYRITPSLKGAWGASSLFQVFTGYLVIDPFVSDFALTKDKPVQGIDFEVLRKSFFSGRVLP